MDNRHMVIVGAGLAGASAAEAMRSEGFKGPVTIIGAEARAPYIRPPLSKGFLAGKDTEESTAVQGPSWYADHDVALRLGESVTGIDPAAGTIQVQSSGRESPTVHYNRLLIATGARPRRLTVPGSDADGIHYLRTLDDSIALHGVLAGGGKKVVLVGSGWIGLEVAATARTLGNEVTVLGREQIPLGAVLGDEIGTVFADLHRQHGVQFRLPASAASFTTTGGRLSGVVTDAGETIAADLAVVAIGVVPDLELGREAGLAIGNGIDTDDSMRTSDRRIFAAGDVANPLLPALAARQPAAAAADARLRSEHWANAIATGKVAGKAMLSGDARLTEIPYFYTDQFDLGMEYSGYAPLTRDARLVIRGSLATRRFIAFWLRDGKVVAGMNVNIWDVQEDIKKLINSGRTFTAADLADETKELSAL